ncbi:MAG: succinate dehydrogenase, cytochrome b556 subunit [Bauldia sp.]|nr:succinate dehydrogenase, cytochrome b556 subunit [Bauldia sp.]
MAPSTGRSARPISPHLQIYSWAGTMAMSIAHRVTGAGLYFGMALLAWWLLAAAIGPGAFDFVNRQLGTWYGTIILIVFSWSLVHHALGGIRHLVWDVGAGFDRKTRTFLAWGTLVGSAVLTAALWVVVLLVRS